MFYEADAVLTQDFAQAAIRAKHIEYSSVRRKSCEYSLARDLFGRRIERVRWNDNTAVRQAPALKPNN
jgi:hypothetical protein